MHIIAISAANIRHVPQGKSVALAQQFLAILQRQVSGITGEVIALVDKNIQPCIGCGGCIGANSCVVEDDFPSIYAKMCAADGLVFVSPHYAPIPAKLCALLERVESIAFLNWWRDEHHQSALGGKPTALIGHGGAVGDDAQRFYYDVVLVPLKNALGFPVGAKIVTVSDWPHVGVICGPNEVQRGEQFPVQIYDDEAIDKLLHPLAASLTAEILGSV